MEIWEIASGERKYVQAPKEVGCLSFSPDGKALVFGQGKEIRWDWGPDKEIMTWKATTTRVNSLAFSADGTRLAATFDYASDKNDNRACVWNAKTGEKLLEIPFAGLESDAKAIAFSPDGKTIATAHFVAVCLWDAQTGKRLSRIKHKGWINCLAFSTDGKRLGGADVRGVYVWDIP